MGTIVVKNVPEDLHERLKERAERNHRSMTGEVIHLLSATVGGEPGPNAPPRPLLPPVALRSGRTISIEEFEAGVADHSANPSLLSDGREALRAALVKQPDGSFVNVLGIDDASFFETLARIRAEAEAPDVEHLFDDKT
jgi:plasmid stability protein